MDINSLDDSVRITYFGLLCKFENHNILETLKSGNWPPSECLEFTQKYDLKLPTAYICTILGQYDAALDIYKGIIQKSFYILIIGLFQNQLETF